PQRGALAAEAGRRRHRGGAERPAQARSRAGARCEAPRHAHGRGQEEDDREAIPGQGHGRRRGVTRRRLDAELVRRGLAVSRAAAKEMVESGHVRVAGSVAARPATMVTPDVAIDLTGADERPFAPDLVVADLSFISLTRVLPALTDLAAPGATFVVLLKPQFEAGRGDVGSGGVVRDPAVWHRVIDEVIAAAGSRGLGAR